MLVVVASLEIDYLHTAGSYFVQEALERGDYPFDHVHSLSRRIAQRKSSGSRGRTEVVLHVHHDNQGVLRIDDLLKRTQEFLHALPPD